MFLRHLVLLLCVDDCLVCIPDGHIVARNMQRLTDILRIYCAPSWLYSQDCTGMHGQQNIKLKLILKKEEWDFLGG